MFLRLVGSQAKFRWQTTLLISLTLTSLVTLYVYIGNTSRYSNRSMQLVMKHMGHNLRFIPEEASALDSHLCTDNQPLFPAESTEKLAKQRSLPSKYYATVLQKRVAVGGADYILTGITPVLRGDETPEKDNWVKPIPEGTAQVGGEFARTEGLGAGDTFDLMGRTFTIGEVLPVKGTEADFRIQISLEECQEMLGAPGKANLILSFMCLHGGSMAAAEEKLREALPSVLPGFQLIVNTDIADARYLARMTTAKSLYYILGLVLTITVLVIVVSGLHDVNERRRETGILVAMGTGYSYIVGLYIAKILLISLVASVAGFLAGSGLAIWFTKPFLVVNTRPVGILWNELPNVVGLAVLVAAVSEILPVVKLLRLDPNATLTEE